MWPGWKEEMKEGEKERMKKEGRKKRRKGGKEDLNISNKSSLVRKGHCF